MTGRRDPAYLDEVRRLMQCELDGVNPPQSTEELKRLLRDDDELAREYECMSRLVRALESAPAVDAPSGLEARTMTAVERAARIAAADDQPGFIRWFAGAFSRRGARFAPTFAAGLAAGALAFWVLIPQSSHPPDNHILDISQISGTMVPVHTPVDFTLVDSLRLDFAGTVGAVRVQHGVDRSGVHHVMVGVDLRGNSEISWTLGGRRATVQEFRTIMGSVSGLFDPDGTHVTHQRGNSRVLVHWVLSKSDDDPLTFAASSGDIQVLGKTVLGIGRGN